MLYLLNPDLVLSKVFEKKSNFHPFTPLYVLRISFFYHVMWPIIILILGKGGENGIEKTVSLIISSIILMLRKTLPWIIINAQWCSFEFVVSQGHILSHVHVPLWVKEACYHCMKQCSNSMVWLVDRYVHMHGMLVNLCTIQHFQWNDCHLAFF